MKSSYSNLKRNIDTKKILIFKFVRLGDSSTGLITGTVVL